MLLMGVWVILGLFDFFKKESCGGLPLKTFIIVTNLFEFWNFNLDKLLFFTCIKHLFAVRKLHIKYFKGGISYLAYYI